jgi:TM2 domain-containing membrane protein YozV
MSSGVSQIEYWLGTNKNAGANNQNSNGKDGKEGGDGAIYLSYDVFMALAVIGGFFALDHLYLRSPLTFLAKIVINLLFFGVWWIWDALQAVFNDDVTKVFGLGVPSLGPKGIAAGVLANDVPDKKHMRFFIYAICLMFTGIFGVDSFLLGDKTSGFIRLISLITLIFSPIALGWWLYKLFKFFFDTLKPKRMKFEQRTMGIED